MSGIGGIMGLVLSGGGKKCNIYTSNATWVCPGADTPVRILVIAGGGGGGGMNNGGTSYPHGGAGGTSSFGALISAVGGGRGYGVNYQNGRIATGHGPNTTEYKQRTGERVGSSYGTASGWWQRKGANLSYMIGCSGFIQGKGASGYMGVGSGGNGSDQYMINSADATIGGAGGGAGNFAEWEGLISVNTSVTVGAGGAEGVPENGGGTGFPGQKGIVIVWWEE